ncbi:MAG TPA: IS66 family transposase [Polyangiaceae bacterium]|nr:IS66 family transposase [Polyangiaceae bacterium]
MAASEQVDERLTKALADVAELRALLAERDRQIAHLTKMLFARKSERLADDKQPKLPLSWDEPAPPPPPHVDEAADEEYEEVTYKRKKRGATRISKDLPREVRTIELPEAERRCPCCNETMCKIGEEVSERVDFTPALLKVIETRRDKYACKKHEEAGVLTPPLPIHPIAKGMATAGLLSQVLVAKYKDHLPLYRQSRIFARHGAEIAESTLCDWVKSAAEMLQPVVAAVKESVLASHVVQSDDTAITVLDSSHANGSRRSFLWAYVGDRDEVVFDFTLGRGREGPRTFLGDYRGLLQVDAYAGYEVIFQTGRVTEVGCWAHARRRFFDALDGEKEHAGNALAVLRRLYEIEREAKELGLDFSTRRELRQREAKPLLEAMHMWLVALKPTVLPKTPLGDAIGYTLRQWDPLTRYLDDGSLAIDNNRVERQMRTVAVGRKNWMFAGSTEGAQRAATIYSLVCTCSLLDVEPWAYLKDVLQRLAESQDPAQLTPRLWKAARDNAATA